jgi:patatin-like phospholipase/acyl hydrolase
MTSSNGEGGQNRSFRILSIDGGGVRALIPALVLAAIEKRTGKSICELFDLIAGTSTGGILALALACPSEAVASRPQYAASELVGLYRERWKTIFDRPRPLALLRRFAPRGFSPLLRGDVRDLFRPKYGDAGRETVLKSYLRYRLRDALTGLFVTSYDTMLRKPVFFVSDPSHAIDADYYHNVCDVFALDAALATSATPTYFPPQRVSQPNYFSPPGYYSLVDGGVFANNPTFVAATHAVKHYRQQPALANMLVVSLGTGSLTRNYNYQEARRWGQVAWAVPALEMAFDGQSDAVGSMMDQVLSPNHYHRFQIDLTDVNDDIDDMSEENLKAMERATLRMLDQRARRLDELCARLDASVPLTRKAGDDRQARANFAESLG